MTPLNPTTGDYQIGTRSANALSALGFFAEQTAALELGNGSFEGPYAGTSNTPYVVNPSGGQWVFTGTSGLARNGSEWYAPLAPDGQQAAFIEDDGDDHTNPLRPPRRHLPALVRGDPAE